MMNRSSPTKTRFSLTLPESGSWRSEFDSITQITPQIYLSGIRPLERSPAQLARLGITHILCCVDQIHVVRAQKEIVQKNPKIVIMSLPYRDEESQSLWADSTNIALTKMTRTPEDVAALRQTLAFYRNMPLIEAGYHFIDQALENGGRVLIHCMAGISRSSSVLIYYLMRKNNESFTGAVRLVRSFRSIVAPNRSFQLQLINYGKVPSGYSDKDCQDLINYLQR